MACNWHPLSFIMCCTPIVARLLLVFGIGICEVSTANATTFVRMDERDLAARATVAVIGVVQSVGQSADAPTVTRVVIEPERVVLGELPPGPLVLDEPGGRGANGVVERIFGAPVYRAGEHVLVFATRRADGRWRTTAMAMGKYEIEAGDQDAARRFESEVMVIDPDARTISAGPILERSRLTTIIASIESYARLHSGGAGHASPQASSLGRTTPIAATPSKGALIGDPDYEAFTYQGDPSRWFEPDDGLPVVFQIDQRGDSALGAAASVGAAVDALASWTTAGDTSLLLADATLGMAVPFEGCEGENRIVFDDPFGEIDAPSDCRGVLGVGSYCYVDEQRTINGTAFNRIQLGKVAIADGFGACDFWTPCNLAQIITHEVGHAIGLGHSLDAGATMAATAHFDGRCDGLGADDIVGVRFMYPPVPRATPSSTPSSTVRPSTAAATRTPTVTPCPTSTRTRRPINATPQAAPYRLTGRISYYSSGTMVPGVDVATSGGMQQNTATSTHGAYAFTNLPNAGMVVCPSKVGETSRPSALDAADALQGGAMDPVRQLACDVTGDGRVNVLDAAEILQRVVGRITQFHGAELCGSEWLFVPDAALVANLDSVTPSMAPGACHVGALSYAPLQSDATEQNFRAAVLGDCTGNWLPKGDERSLEPVLAPPGSALVVTPLRRRPGRRWRLAIGVQAPDAMRALELQLRYDAVQLAPAHVRTVGAGKTALVDSNVPIPGRLSIALAGGVPIPTDGRAVIVVDFSALTDDIPRSPVRPYTVVIDARAVP